MSFPSRLEAERLLEKVIEIRNATLHPFTDKMEITFRAHSRTVAKIAEILAKKTTYLNIDKAYVCGLLHDCGRMLDEWNEHVFHGLVGYQYMMSLGYDDVAKICLTHNFYSENFQDEDYLQFAEFIPECRNIMKNFHNDEYDKLIALSDMLNDMGKPCSIEYRLQSVSTRHKTEPEQLERLKNDLYNLKSFFDEKCHNDVYKILAIK